MRTPALILIVTAATLPMARAGPSRAVYPAREDRAEETARKLKELRKERIAVQKEAVEAGTTLAKNARIEVWDAREVGMTLLKAELDASEKESERLSLYKKAVDSLKGYEELAKARV